MIQKCANPTCSRTLMRMDGGRFFGFPTSGKSIEHFWLCTNCSRTFTLVMNQGKVELSPKLKRKTA
jgi:hypothetical protein